MKQENPAKVYLRRYRSLCGTIDALNRAINEAMERATNTSATIHEIKVRASPAEHDKMAEIVCNAVDATAILQAEKSRAQEAVSEILGTINGLTDERQREVLLRRYINGEGFEKIKADMHYEKTQIFVIHGRALLEINKILNRRSER